MQHELLLRPSKVKWLGGLAASVALVLCGALLRAERPVIGWLSIVFFGACATVAIVQLVPNVGLLRLTPSGFQTRSLFRTRFIPWSDVSHFAVCSPAGSPRMVGVVFDETQVDTTTQMHRLSKAMAGVDEALPDTYGMSAEALTELMNQWCLRYRPAPQG